MGTILKDGMRRTGQGISASSNARRWLYWRHSQEEGKT